MPNKADIINELRDSIKTIRDTINTQPGSAVNDIILTPLTDTIYKQRVHTLLISVFQSFDLLLELQKNESLMAQTAMDLDITIDELDTTITEIIEKSSANWGVYRRKSTLATGFVYFYITVEDYVSPITIPANTVVSRVDGIEYSTPNVDYVLDNTNQSSLLNAYFVNVPIEALESGLSGNTAERTIVNYPESLQITGVINLNSLGNGLDEQTNEEMVEVVRTKLTGNNLGVENGYISLIMDNFAYVDELLLVGPSDVEMKRNQYGGSIDVYIKGSLPTEIEYTMNSIPEQQEYKLQFLPANNLSILGFTEGVEYEFSKDKLLFRDSSKANDKIIWKIATPESWTVVHTYDKLIYDIQEFLDDRDNKIVDTDILVRQTYEIFVDVSLSVSLFSGYSFSETRIQIQNAIAEFIFKLGLNESLITADLIRIVQEFKAVRNTRNVVISVDSNYQDLIDDMGDLHINRTQFASPRAIDVERLV